MIGVAVEWLVNSRCRDTPQQSGHALPHSIAGEGLEQGNKERGLREVGAAKPGSVRRVHPHSCRPPSGAVQLPTHANLKAATKLGVGRSSGRSAHSRQAGEPRCYGCMHSSTASWHKTGVGEHNLSGNSEHCDHGEVCRGMNRQNDGYMVKRVLQGAARRSPGQHDAKRRSCCVRLLRCCVIAWLAGCPVSWPCLA